ncbi:MAG TPA: glycine cleavage T C-terminal barrel domain-containing protein [Acidobacteriota bacterium]|nr:glycine cleavage T C-terminal barrel domain-containing protein [Acidobacteriota bacterium]
MSLATAFADTQRSAGAELREANGLVYASDYGDREGELRAARTATALIWQPWRAYLSVTGDERLAFLHRLLSANVEALQPGDNAPGLLLDTRGKVQASLNLWLREEAVLIASDEAVISSVAEQLGRYVLRSAVQVVATPLVSLAFVGPGHGAVAGALGLELPATPRQPAGGGTWRSVRTGRLPGSFEIASPEADAIELWNAACELGDESARPAGRSVSEVLRVEAGVPEHGAELTGNELPQEARLEHAVDFEKGCYLGQETVARIHFRGQVSRLLCGLRLEAAVEPGATLSSGGRGVGNVTSAVVSECHGRIGLGYVRRELADPDMELRVGDGSTARVAPLPFNGCARLGAAT